MDKHVYQHSPRLDMAKDTPSSGAVIVDVLQNYDYSASYLYTTVDRNILSKAIDIILKK